MDTRDTRVSNPASQANKPLIKMIVFDLDGTLVDTRDFIINELSELSVSYKFDKLDEVDIHRLRSSRSLHFLKVLGIPLWKGPFIIRRIQKKLSEKIADMKFVPGLREVLITLKSEEYILGVATSNSFKNMELFFEKYEGKFFDFKHANIFIFGKHRMLKRIGKKHNIPLENIYYIGDETRDVIAAKKAGVHVIAVTWGFNNREILEKYNPDFIVESPEEILLALNGQLKAVVRE